MLVKIFSGDLPWQSESEFNSFFESGDVEITQIDYECHLSSKSNKSSPSFHYSLSMVCEQGTDGHPIRAKIFGEESKKKLE